MKIAIVYTSISGNTKEVAELLFQQFYQEENHVDLYSIHEFDLARMDEYDALLIGTYTWGDGELPESMWPLYQRIEKEPFPSLITGVFGTGDCFYPKYCGAVDVMKDLLQTQTNLAVTLKIELSPQLQDIGRCEAFVEKIVTRYHSKYIQLM
ncbi:flavodoxin domain-containing protein [Cytobacillus spongiae]|jgi:flavodoxin I|uniref:flavodoxin domain-containing protein n=1 Tax=Cytobacillus spongiae TaxID=2901381 RepID=UPI001F2CB4CF|nr:flavodoxin domain-containing protein [Cytobacillus spongiae]UII54362.1 flavodoxin domain-containing protein [Cytobacillus spongiae]